MRRELLRRRERMVAAPRQGDTVHEWTPHGPSRLVVWQVAGSMVRVMSELLWRRDLGGALWWLPGFMWASRVRRAQRTSEREGRASPSPSGSLPGDRSGPLPGDR